MTKITTFSKRYVGQLESVDFPNPRLASDFGINDLEFTVTAPLFNEDGDVPTLDGSLVIRNLTTKYAEGINVKASNISADGLTVTLDDLTQRGLPVAGENGVDYAGGIEGNRSSHQKNSEVRWQISPLDNMAIQMTLTGEIGTGSRKFRIGDGTTNTSQGFEIDQGLATPTKYGVNATGEPVVTLPNGSSFVIGAGIGTITGGDGIAVTAGDINIDTTDTTIFVETTAGATDEGKVVLLDSNGLIVKENLEIVKDITATASEINQALEGISANVTDTNLNTLTAGTSSNADSLHIHGVGVVNLAVKTFTNTTQNATGTGNLDFAVGSSNALKCKFQYTIHNGYGDAGGHNRVFEAGVIEYDLINSTASVYYKSVSSSDVGAGETGLLSLYGIQAGYDGLLTQKSTLPSVSGPLGGTLVITSITKSTTNIRVSYSYDVPDSAKNPLATLSIGGTAY